MSGNKSVFVLQALLPLLTLCFMYNGDLFKNPACRKMNVPLLYDSVRIVNWELCEKIEYLNSVFRVTRMSVRQIAICSMAILSLDSVICFVSRRTIVERKVRRTYIAFVLALIGVFMLVQGIVFKKTTTRSSSNFDMKTAASLFSEIKIVPKGKINRKVPDCFVMFIDKVVLFAPFLLAIEAGAQIKRMWVRTAHNKCMGVKGKQLQLAHKQIGLKTLIFENKMLTKSYLRSCSTITDRCRWSQANDCAVMLRNVIWNMSEGDTTKQVMVHCTDMIGTHLLNDSEATLFRWLCLCTTSALFRAKGDIEGMVTNSTSQLKKISKLGSMLCLQTQTFNGIRLISKLRMVDYRHNDITFDIRLDRGSLVLNALCRQRSDVRDHLNCLKLSEKFLSPLQPRIQRRLDKYNVISMSGSAQRVNEALKEFEKRTIQLIHNPFVRQDVVEHAEGFHVSREQKFRKRH